MTKYYAIAIDSKTNKSFRIVNLPENHAAAMRKAKNEAVRLGLEFKYIRPLSKREGSTLTKYRDYRRRAGQL
ncbi:hypothetical protein [Paenibacillus xylaniclasticus]|uniref:hypothetical protein n=1 Tax=Paenibacillus xylaniclasticus TaxID=588083 RepID=UPI000FD8A653|nr:MULTISPECIES: hypothetical protein [Paenibacillus]GFN32432.1 hypothetical protein PCURB6_26920 [Paenibacillus curdlanolyticus]